VLKKEKKSSATVNQKTDESTNKPGYKCLICGKFLKTINNTEGIL